MKQDIEVDLDNSCRNNLGRPRKTTVYDCRQIIGTLQSLRRSVGTFSLTDIQEAVEMNATILNNCQMCLVYEQHSYGYQYAQNSVS